MILHLLTIVLGIIALLITVAIHFVVSVLAYVLIHPPIPDPSTGVLLTYNIIAFGISYTTISLLFRLHIRQVVTDERMTDIPDEMQDMIVGLGNMEFEEIGAAKFLIPLSKQRIHSLIFIHPNSTIIAEVTNTGNKKIRVEFCSEWKGEQNIVTTYPPYPTLLKSQSPPLILQSSFYSIEDAYRKHVNFIKEFGSQINQPPVKFESIQQSVDMTNFSLTTPRYVLQTARIHLRQMVVRLISIFVPMIAVTTIISWIICYLTYSEEVPLYSGVIVVLMMCGVTLGTRHILRKLGLTPVFRWPKHMKVKPEQQSA